MTEIGGYCFLHIYRIRPREGNVHTLMPADDEPCGFLDVLMPSYTTTEHGADINYYEVERVVGVFGDVVMKECIRYYAHCRTRKTDATDTITCRTNHVLDASDCVQWIDTGLIHVITHGEVNYA